MCALLSHFVGGDDVREKRQSPCAVFNLCYCLPQDSGCQAEGCCLIPGESGSCYPNLNTQLQLYNSSGSANNLCTFPDSYFMGALGLGSYDELAGCLMPTGNQGQWGTYVFAQGSYQQGILMNATCYE